MKQPPFNDFLGQYLVQILSPRREAAFLYDAIKLYAKSLKESLENGEDVFNGTRIIERLKNRSYTRYEILFFLICSEKLLAIKVVGYDLYCGKVICNLRYL